MILILVLQFHSDVFALLATDEATPAFSWLSLPISKDSDKVEARGWFASCQWGDKILIHGGLNEKNERLGDAFLLDISVE